jgi:limonene-1,2-epoxide hydrolase
VTVRPPADLEAQTAPGVALGAGARRPASPARTSSERAVLNLICGLRLDMLAAIDRWLTPDVLWINACTVCHGRSDCLDVIEALTNMGITHVESEVSKLTSGGQLVFAERRHTVLTPSGEPQLCVEVAGTFRVRDDRVRAWVDRFDPAALHRLLPLPLPHQRKASSKC